MSDPREEPAGDAQAAVAIATTEHFNLQSERSATTSEANGRASIFLGVVSGVLIALGFAAQAGKLVDFGLAVLPVLVFVGLATFERVIQCGIEDLGCLKRINRIRRFYVDAAPSLGPWLAPPAPTDAGRAVLRVTGMRPGGWQLVLTVGGTIGVINSVLVGAFAAFAATWLNAPATVAVLTAGVAFAVAAVLHDRYLRFRWRSAPGPFDDEVDDEIDDEPRGPSEPNDASLKA